MPSVLCKILCCVMVIVSLNVGECDQTAEVAGSQKAFLKFQLPPRSHSRDHSGRSSPMRFDDTLVFVWLVVCIPLVSFVDLGRFFLVSTASSMQIKAHAVPHVALTIMATSNSDCGEMAEVSFIV